MVFWFVYKIKVITLRRRKTENTQSNQYNWKQSTLKQYVLPFIRVNTIMICGWVIIVLLFKMSKWKWQLAYQSNTAFSFCSESVHLFISCGFIALFQQIIPELGKEWQHRPAVGFIRNGSLHVHIAKNNTCMHSRSI